jgi:hypothetical protein
MGRTVQEQLSKLVLATVILSEVFVMFLAPLGKYGNIMPNQVFSHSHSNFIFAVNPYIRS